MLLYYSLITSIRGNIVNGTEMLNIDVILSNLLKRPKCSNYFYKEILKRDYKNEKRIALIKWERKFNEVIEWNSIFTNINVLTIDTQIRNFQFKLLPSIFPNNYILCKMAKRESG